MRRPLLVCSFIGVGNLRLETSVAGKGSRTICCVANLRISFMARGALFLKVAPWSYIGKK